MLQTAIVFLHDLFDPRPVCWRALYKHVSQTVLAVLTEELIDVIGITRAMRVWTVVISMLVMNLL